jgi:hypothetical protein
MLDVRFNGTEQFAFAKGFGEILVGADNTPFGFVEQTIFAG